MRPRFLPWLSRVLLHPWSLGLAGVLGVLVLWTVISASGSVDKLFLPSPAPSARKDDASPFRPFQPPGGLMEPTNASLQRGRQG